MHTIIIRMAQFPKSLFEPYSADKKDFEYRLERFLNQVIFYSVLLSFPAIIYSVYIAFRQNEPFVVAFELFVYLLLAGILFIKRVPFKIRSFLFVILYYLLGSFVLHKVGPDGAGLIYLFSFPLFSALLLDLRAALISVFMTVITLAGMTLIIYKHGSYTLEQQQIWLVLVSNFIVLETILAIQISSLFTGLKKTYLHKQQALEKADISEKRMKLISDNAFDAILFYNDALELTYYNRGALDYLYPAEGAPLNNLIDVLPRIHPDDRADVRKHFREFADHSGTRAIFNFRYLGMNGSYRYLEITAIDFRKDPLLGRIVATIRDITDAKLTEDQVVFYKNNDPVTGFLNENGFREALRMELDKISGRREKLALLCLGMDELKKIRPRLSGREWSRLLEVTSIRLGTLFRDDDILGKLSSDRFLVALSNICKTRDVPDIIDKIHTEFKKPIDISGRQISLSWSAGITLYPEDFRDAAELMRNSETSLDYLKQNRMVGYLFYNQKIYNSLIDQIEMEEAIRIALGNRSFRLYYQPKVDSDQKLAGFEALLRWQGPDGSFISPDIFIPIAEQGGMIRELGNYVIEEAVLQLRTWLDQGCQPHPIAVNISPAQLNDDHFVFWIKDLILKNEIPTDLLELEITERDIQNDEVRIISAMKALQDEGIRFSIDDFGTGYSSLIRLKEYPVYAVKIDKAFIQDLPANSESAGIVRSILMLADNLNFKVVAEGIEQQQQFEYLTSYNCHFFQGYYFCKPLPPEEAVQYLKPG